MLQSVLIGNVFNHFTPPTSLSVERGGNFCHIGGWRCRPMATMNISLPDLMRDYVQNRIDSGQYASVSDYVRDLIRRDQSAIMDEERWLKELDASIDESLQEMKAGGGHDFDEVCDALIADIQTMTNGQSRP
ncbi:type II toxin-antitoxin system ParD family antitoxin [Sphingobium sp. HWE2-09]|uniref:type II toxin-antitoxin system ParD family antitoxin n=1 Tax=Sphingobium sp. HWE2-09 TaxID=3108390 RepID=UPI002DCBB01F|nr:type II toxin-antitoxin system ParD family antitoxin [Sphingobium sp. HWE2-09]